MILNIKRDSSHSFGMTNDAVISTEGRNLLRQESLSFLELLSRYIRSLTFVEMTIYRIISISRGKIEGSPEGAKRSTAGDEPREFTSRGEGGRVPPFLEVTIYP